MAIREIFNSGLRKWSTTLVVSLSENFEKIITKKTIVKIRLWEMTSFNIFWWLNFSVGSLKLNLRKWASWVEIFYWWICNVYGACNCFDDAKWRNKCIQGADFRIWKAPMWWFMFKYNEELRRIVRLLTP